MTRLDETRTRTAAPATGTQTPATGAGALGAPLDRRDGRAKVTGTASYAAEHPLEDLAWAHPVLAAAAHARITEVDTDAARALPGVIEVLTHENAPRLVPSSRPWPVGMGMLARSTTVDPLNTDTVHHDGQPVALVVAETPEIAAEAAGLVRVVLEPLPAKVDLAAHRHETTRQRAMPMPRTGGKVGDAPAALERAEVRVDLEFRTPQQNHNALELHGCTARWDGDRLTLWEGHQQLEAATKFVAARFGLDPGQVRIVSTFVGGAFGGRSAVWAHTLMAAMAARVVGRPVRLTLSREAVYRLVGGRPQTFQRVALGAQRDGRLTSLIHQVDLRKGTVGGSGEQVVSASGELYACENILLEQNIVALNLLPQTWMRAPGESIGTFALESAVDELAYELDLDPVELRQRNQPDRHPVSGNEFSHHTVARSLQEGARLFGWDRRPARAGTWREGDDLVGWGVATAVHPALDLRTNLTLRLTAEGRLLVRCGLHEIGVGASTATAQIAAHLMDLPVEQVDVEHGDSTLPWSAGAGGSAQTASVARALLVGCADLRAQLDRLAQTSGGSRPEEIMRAAGAGVLEAQVGSDTGLGALAGNARLLGRTLRSLRSWSKAASGAHFCEVRVDAVTGETRVTRWVGVFDVGRVVNAKTVASQLRGGIVMGLGLAMSEETLIDPRTGRIVNPSLSEYHVPVHADVPELEVHVLDDPDPQQPLGILGAGEVGITGVGAAVANAVRHATGVRVLDLPITLDRVLPGDTAAAG